MNNKNNTNQKINKKFALLKKNCLRLRANYQLPNELCVEIIKLGSHCNDNFVNHLMELSEHYLRVNGYYKKYPEVHTKINDLIKEDLKQFKNSVD